MTFTEAIDQMFARLDEDNRAVVLMTAEPFDPEAYDRFVPDVARDCGIDGDHIDAYWDGVDGTARCIECDSPIVFTDRMRYLFQQSEV